MSRAAAALACAALAACARGGAAPRAAVQAHFDCRAPGRRISPLIYGVGYAETRDAARALPWELGATAVRWGGNSSSRYNWELGNAWNTASDWFFRNVDYSGGEPGAAYARLIEENLAHGLATALTVPMLGWVAKDTTSVSFPVAAYGAQQAMDSSAKAGDGLSRAGESLPPGPPSRTSVPAPPEFIGRWVSAIRAADARRGSRGVQQYILDNEPMLWHETHRDVHPQPAGYDELLDRTLRYGAAVRAADPQAVIAGPALWGWPAYFYSAIDKREGFRKHPDRRAHGDVPLLPWYLRQLKAAEEKGGPHILDLVDVHFYPQADGMGLGTRGAVDARTAALRVRSVRGLWDPAYRDESYIDEPIRLLPRLREWIDANDPGLGISIGEYNFGAEGHISGGLALAEALGRFAQFDATSAFYWTAPPRDSPAYRAFRAYRNYDGKGGRFQDLFLGAASFDRLSLFASRSPDGSRAVVIAVNARESAAEVALQLDGCGGRGSLFTSTGAEFRQQPWTAGAPVVLPAMSISVVERRAGQ